MPTTTFYLRSDTAATAGSSPPANKPSTWGGAASYANAPAMSSSLQKALMTTAGSAQQTIGVTAADNQTTSGSQKWPALQYIGPNNMIAGTYSAAAWTIALAGLESSAAVFGAVQWDCGMAIYLYDSTGAKKTTIYAPTTPNASTNKIGTTELTAFANPTPGNGATFTVASGDYLVFEYSLATNDGGTPFTLGGSGTNQLFDCGTTAISSDTAGTSDAKVLITAPYTLLAAAATDLSTWLPSQDPVLNQHWQQAKRSWWNTIRSIPATVMPEPAFFLNDPNKALPVPLVSQQNATVELPRGAQAVKTRQSVVASAPVFVDGGPAFITDDPFKRPTWQNLPIETPRSQALLLGRAKSINGDQTYFDPTAYSIFSLTIPPAFVFEQPQQGHPGPRAFSPVRPDPTELFDESLYPDFTGLIQAQPWQAQWPKQPPYRTLTPYSSEIHVTLPLPSSIPFIEDWSAGPQMPVRTLRSPRWQDSWPASDPILVNPTSVPPFPATVPNPLQSRVKRSLPPLHDVPIILNSVVIPPGPAEQSHAYEFQIGTPLRTAYKRPVSEGGAVRVPTFLVEVIEDVYQVWNVQIGVPVRRKALFPQPAHVAELSRTAPAQVPPMEPWDVSPVLPTRPRLSPRTGESVGKVLPFLEDVSVAQGWSVPVAPRPASRPFRVVAQPETIATLPEAVDVRIWHFELCQTQPVARPALAGRWPTPAMVIAPAVLDSSLLALEYLAAQVRPAGRRLPLHTQQVSLERTAPAQIPAMEPFDVVQTPLRRRQILRQPAEAPTKIAPAVEDIFLLEAWVQPAMAYPPRQPRRRPLSQEQRPPETAFFLNIPYNAASFQVWNVTPLPVPHWRRSMAMVPQQQMEGQASPSWQASQVIVAAGPYVAIAASIYVAGAVQGEARNE